MNLLKFLIALDDLGVRQVFREDDNLILLPDSVATIEQMNENGYKIDHLCERNPEAKARLLSMVHPFPADLIEVAR